MGEDTEGTVRSEGSSASEWDLVALTPTFMESEHAQYANAIVTALKNPLIRNIALSGNYGVGKSSILQEVSRLKGDEVVELSLSTLAPIEQSDLDDSVPRQATTPTNRIQQEIVKQLLYREEPDNAAGSRFRRIERFNPWRETVLAALVGLVITLIFLIAGWGATIVKTLEPLGEIGLWVYPGVFLVASGAAYLARWLLHGRVHIKQFSAGPAAVTLDEKSVSYFDQYLDEIVYFFETSKHRVVIFEDIDRFNDSHIFETLRSLNTLLNSAPQIENRPVRFIYAIKDSIFDRIGLEQEGRKADTTLVDVTDPAQAETIRANRTKFFDLVIPVVPFITHRSARNLTTQILRGIDHKVSDDLVDLAARFVPDMRLLKNVRNEFVVFRDRIFSGDGEQLKLSETDLFAMMLYKSTHLSDFEVIRLGQSKLDRLYEASRSLVTDNVTRIEREIRVAKHQLARAGNAGNRAQRLGDKLFVQLDIMIRSANLTRYNERYEYAGVVRTADYFSTSAFWKDFVEGDGTSPVIWRNMYHGQVVSITRPDVATALDDTLNVETWKEVDREAINERIAEHQQELEFLRSGDMGDLIKRPEFLVDFEDEELPLTDVAERLLARGLAFELIRAGFIDRNFTLYTSTFHGDRVSPAATNFIIHHVERGRMDEHFKLSGEDVDAVVRERKAHSLGDPALFNIAILDHLLATNSPYAESMVSAIARLEPDARRFVQSYFEAGSQSRELVARLTVASPRTLAYLVSEVDLDDEKRLQLVSNCLESLHDGARPRTDDACKQYLAANYAQLPALTEIELSVAAARRVAQLFKTMAISIPDLRLLSDSARAAFVRQGLYDLTFDNLSSALGGGELSLDVIREKNPQHVYPKVLGELPAYLSAVDGRVPSNASAEQFAVLIAAVHEAAPGSVERFIAAASDDSIVQNIDDVPEETWEALGTNERFTATFANVTKYIAHAGSVDQPLAAVLAGADTISGIDGVEEAAKQELAVTLIGAAPLLRPVLRATLAESLNLKRWVDVSRLPQESGVLFGELRERLVIADDAATWAHLANTDWATKERVLRASPKFAEWATPELVPGDLGQILASSAASDAAKRVIVGQAEAYAPHGGIAGLKQLARLALDFGVAVKYPLIVQFAAARVPADQVLTLLLPYLGNATGEHLHAVLSALGGEYEKLSYVGYQKPKIPNSPAALLLLDQLSTKGHVASFDRTQNPIKVNKRLK
ncbi:MAG: DNA-binding protein [Herbiconiux sp.]|uniref:YobI family P-loop NTPase n=1 Tax=Herbiconiux sp. TaxID=1871186 RepID=UPI001229E4B8|nr:DNA-binding protein [Herbiconiux sp.]TAJ49454.1 MAG: DNA-binding protein [Herbiconiux sp.]